MRLRPPSPAPAARRGSGPLASLPTNVDSELPALDTQDTAAGRPPASAGARGASSMGAPADSDLPSLENRAPGQASRALLHVPPRPLPAAVMRSRKRGNGRKLRAQGTGVQARAAPQTCWRARRRWGAPRQRPPPPHTHTHPADQPALGASTATGGNDSMDVDLPQESLPQLTADGGRSSQRELVSGRAPPRLPASQVAVHPTGTPWCAAAWSVVCDRHHQPAGCQRWPRPLSPPGPACSPQRQAPGACARPCPSPARSWEPPWACCVATGACHRPATRW